MANTKFCLQITYCQAKNKKWYSFELHNTIGGGSLRVAAFICRCRDYFVPLHQTLISRYF